MTTSPIYELIKAEVDRSGNAFIKQKIEPWVFFNVKGVKIEKSDGTQINISGFEFSGSARLVFWDGFVDEELTVLALSLFEDARAKAIEHGVSIESSILACNDCLSGLVLRVFERMADIDQRLRGKGYPNSVSKENVGERASNLCRVIEKFSEAHIASAKAGKNKVMMNIDSLLELLEAYSLSQEETSILSGIQHDRLVEAVNVFIFHHGSLLGVRGWSDVTQGLRDPGVDAVWQCSIGGATSKLGIQVKSHGDFSSTVDSFRRVVLSQISDSRRINPERLLLILGADLTNASQREKARGIISDIQQMQDNYVVTISPEKVAGLWRWNEKLNVSVIDQMREAGYPWLTTVYDTVGNINQNSWGKGTGGGWTKTRRTVLYVGEEVGIRAIAMAENADDIQFRFSVQPSGGGFQTRRDWGTCAEWKWLVQESDIGRGVCVMVSVRRIKAYYQFGDSDDYTYAIYDILPRNT